MPRSLVSFVVPCYKLGHLLRACVESILHQTYENLEVLIMDDCSPDNTREVAESFTDPRVKYVRNPVNLGHLRNYNVGIGLAKGEYLWLISADDMLRSEEVLRRFVEILDAHPRASFAFCQAMRLLDGLDSGHYPTRTSPSGVIPGHQFLQSLIDWNFVPAPAAMARRSAYLAAGLFPLDLPYAGDWYLWCRFAMIGDVAYIPEPLVNYRQHSLSMTTHLKTRAGALIRDDFMVRWRVKRLVEELRDPVLTKVVRQTLAEDYARRLTQSREEALAMSEPEVEASIREFAANPQEAERTLAEVMTNLGDSALGEARTSEARRCYRDALGRYPWNLRTATKLASAYAGWFGVMCRRWLASSGEAARYRAN